MYYILNFLTYVDIKATCQMMKSFSLYDASYEQKYVHPVQPSHPMFIEKSRLKQSIQLQTTHHYE